MSATPAGDARDAAFMQRALALAAQGQGRTAPNPMVGAVLVGSAGVLAEGWHRAPGLPHAEVDALSKVGGRADGATLYVNLEPCCHTGRTPPCTEALLASGVRRIVVGMVDPDPRVRGRGIRALQDAGILVEVGLMAEECRRLNAPYLRARTRGRPLVALKAGVTLDGRIADEGGRSKWITSAAARAVAHQLRDRHDAVLVGSGTLLADDPSLNTRIDGGRDARPVVLDSCLRMPAGARVLSAGRPPLVFCRDDAPERPELDQAMIVRVPGTPAGLDLELVLSDLVARGIHSVLVEGGAKVHRSLLEAGVVDRIHLFVAPTVLAGGPGWMGGPPLALADAPRFQLVSADVVGPDVHLVLES